MRTVNSVLAIVLCFALQACSGPRDDFDVRGETAADTDMPETIERALADESRPESDRVLDTNRHPAEVLVFAGVDRGWRVADLSAGSGYYSRVLSTAVGESGHVYAQLPIWVAEQFPSTDAALAALAEQRENVTHIVSDMARFQQGIGEPLDAVFIVLFYHDTVYAGTDRAAMNQAVFDALKLGGVYLVIDHQAPSGTGLAHVEDLHRIDPESVLEEVLAAGFVLERESEMLANPDDPLAISVFDPSIRRQTDRFVYLFRKPQA